MAPLEVLFVYHMNIISFLAITIMTYASSLFKYSKIYIIFYEKKLHKK